MNIQHAGQVIDAECAYTLSEFMARTGLKRDAMRTARKNGLEVIRQHGRVFIIGAAWLRYLESVSNDAVSDPASI